MQRRDFQSLCGMVRSTAMIHIRRICQEGKLQNLGLRNQPIYVPVPGFYGYIQRSADAPVNSRLKGLKAERVLFGGRLSAAFACWQAVVADG